MMTAPRDHAASACRAFQCAMDGPASDHIPVVARSDEVLSSALAERRQAGIDLKGYFLDGSYLVARRYAGSRYRTKCLISLVGATGIEPVTPTMSR